MSGNLVFMIVADNLFACFEHLCFLKCSHVNASKNWLRLCKSKLNINHIEIIVLYELDMCTCRKGCWEYYFFIRRLFLLIPSLGNQQTLLIMY